VIEEHMLELRPPANIATTPLPPESLEARICSYECPVDPVAHQRFAAAIRGIPPEQR
jgi:hypothetical protein